MWPPPATAFSSEFEFGSGVWLRRTPLILVLVTSPLFHLPEPAYWEVRLGKHNIRQKEPTERTHQVAKLFHIKNYRAYDNDLAILKLEEKVEPNEYIRPICLPSNEHFDFSNSECESHNQFKPSDHFQILNRHLWSSRLCLRLGSKRLQLSASRDSFCSAALILASLSLSHWADKRGTDLLQKVKANVYDNLGKLSRLEVDFRNGKVLLVTSFGSPDRLSPGLLSEVQNRDQKLASVRWQ